MASDLEDKKRRAYINRRAISDLGMGAIYAGVGGFFIVSGILGMEIEFPPKPFSYIFGALCMLYGGFRIYRGIKRNYYR
jgi:drug/metabolite transporter superfamily protein YnfA